MRQSKQKPTHANVKPIPAVSVLAARCDPELVEQINAMLTSKKPRGRNGLWYFDVTDLPIEQRQVLQRLYRLAGWDVCENIRSGGRKVYLQFGI